MNLSSCLLVVLSLVMAGCGASPIDPTNGGVSECPAATDPCMNAENHADRLQVERECDGSVVHLESCPLQFGCAEG